MVQASPSEKARYQQALTQMPADFDAMDTNHDGTVSKDEYIAAVQIQLVKVAGNGSAMQRSSCTSTPPSGTSTPPRGTGHAELSAQQLDSPAGAAVIATLEAVVDARGAP